MWRDFCVIIFAALSLIAVVNIGLWILGMSGLLSELAVQGIVLYWFTLGKLDPAPQLYIAMTPEGFFRALWITGTLYVPALLYCVAQRRFWGCVLFAAALIATYTRGLWLGAVIGIAIAQLVSHRMKLFVDGRIAASALVLLLLGALALPLLPQFADQDGVLGLVGYRVSTTFTDSSADERYEQVDPLLYAWQEAPWFGNGFGAQASLLRSEEVSFLYEITALALLMKLGIVGMIAVSVLLGAPWAYSLLRNRPPSRNACASIAGVVAFLVAATTNPYLTNFVGMSAVCFMLLQLHIEHRANVLRR